MSASKHKFLLLPSLLAVALLLPLVQARANEVSSIPGGTVVTMPSVGYFGTGPETVSTGITWSSTNASNQGGSVFGYTAGYGFGANGYWDAAIGPMAGLNDSTAAYGVTDTMTFAFASPVSAVGGFLDYEPGPTPTVVAVYNSSDALIESYDLTFLTGGGTDTGEFVGFSESTADISYFTLTDNYVGITDLTYSASASTTSTPEPGSLLMLGAGILALAAFQLLRKKQAASSATATV